MAVSESFGRLKAGKDEIREIRNRIQWRGRQARRRNLCGCSGNWVRPL